MRLKRPRAGPDGPAVPAPLWVFGYGSLMWRPGFDFAEREPALLRGYHRALCLYSVVHRGTPDTPGLVLGLDRGGSCRGIAFRIAPGKEDATLAYLRAREQATTAYLERRATVVLVDGRDVDALFYIVDRTHSQYAGRLDQPTMMKVVLAGTGISGANPDYVIQTKIVLETLGIHDPVLGALSDALTRTHTSTALQEPD